MHYHVTTSFAGFDHDPAFVTTVQRLFMPGERPKEERPTCFNAVPISPSKPEGPLDHLLGKSVSSFDAEPDELEQLALDGSVRLGPDVFLTEEEARNMAHGKLPERLLRDGECT